MIPASARDHLFPAPTGADTLLPCQLALLLIGGREDANISRVIDILACGW